MEVLYLLIPLAMIFVVIVGFALFWAIRSGQYEDMEGPAYRILMDDDDPLIPGNESRDDRAKRDPDGEGQGGDRDR
ncbi:cbb3-type cytochrome oxidase assembly protein CcoS [Thioalkalivibrio paradoxus]|uniref:Cytochrome oxidase maturation protein Cbb3 n=1 Tax=Thioalkalivibrio paradoxus ARh 1 TaxID=713585 RepID=W0DME5_9GAMM|nr:cbb3-type cytochrome oxidase assembly protein CcoS [Thioalkalivibrio paradoxus]AHE99626.1 cytochrome oxidase maturation protein Cbb3 [Thioalkalivibrio paradoxus ARh 1]